MAVKNPTFRHPDGDDRSVAIASFSAVANGDTTAPLGFQQFADRTVQVTGTLGAGGTVLIEGSNDEGTTWGTLNDPYGTALSITALGVRQISEMTEKVRARVSAGDGTTSLGIHFMLRRPTNPRS